MLSKAITPAIALLAATAHALPRSVTNASAIQWGPCDPVEFNSTVSLECGTLMVPMDYSVQNCTDTVPLQLIRTLAITKPSKGSILFNFGGPGEPGRDNFASTVPLLLPLTGGDYDLIAFDARGTGITLPVSCYANINEAVRSLDQTLPRSNSSTTAPAQLWARAGVDAGLCAQRAAVNASLVNTPFTARDLISIVDALGEDGMLRYYGFSYGTTLGFTVASMFPDRIDKMILDGVQNPHEYYNGFADIEEWTDSDKVFTGIFETCVAAGSNCSLNALGLTAQQMEQATWDVLETFKTTPIPFGDVVLDYSYLKSLIQYSIYGPARWTSLVDSLAALFVYNATEISATGTAVALNTITPASDITALELATALSAIHCGDRNRRASTWEQFEPVLAELWNTSTIMGDGDDLVSFRCARWEVEPKEHFLGSFEVATKNPVLFASNVWDGHTPLKSAYNVSSGFNGSEVLAVKGYGHTTLANPSKCLLQKVNCYWANGTMPASGTVCDIDAPPYSNVSWSDIFAQSGWSDSTGFSKSLR